MPCSEDKKKEQGLLVEFAFVSLLPAAAITEGEACLALRTRRQNKAYLSADLLLSSLHSSAGLLLSSLHSSAGLLLSSLHSSACLLLQRSRVQLQTTPGQASGGWSTSAVLMAPLLQPSWRRIRSWTDCCLTSPRYSSDHRRCGPVESLQAAF